MISCHEVRFYLTQLQDNEIDEESRVKINHHLDRCALCQKEARDLDLMWTFLDECPEIEPSLGFKARVWREVRQLQVPKTFITRVTVLLSRRSWKLATAGACMMALLALGYRVLPITSNDQDKFDNQLLQEVNRLVNTDLDEPLSSSEEGPSAKPEKSDRQNLRNLSKNQL